MSFLEHVVTSLDSVQSLAATYLQDASRWRDVVDFNSLDYPYIVSDPSFQAQTYASGAVTVTRTYTTGALTIPQGTSFLVPAVDGFSAKTYATTQTVTLAPGVSTAEVPVQCTVAGVWGNTPQATVTGISAPDTTLQSAFSSITNTSSFTNGMTLNVRKPGDSILIPVDNTWNGMDTYASLTDFYNFQFGSDLELGDDGDLVFDGYGDIGSVAGIANLAQAMRDRLMTPQTSLVYHPEYGSMLEEYMSTQIPMYAQKMLVLAVTETLLMDDRVDRVNVLVAQKMGTVLQVVVDVFPIQQSQPVRVPVALPNIPYAA